MYRISFQGFVDERGHVTKCIELRPNTAPTDEWHRRQEGSMDEYVQQAQQIPEATRTLYEMFGAYIAKAIHGAKSPKILDIGCGIRAEYPPYVAFLKNGQPERGIIYVGLDPIHHNVSSREYPFICGRIEELPAVLEERFEVFLFATSLDHVENIETVAQAVKRLAAKNAICLFWVGLHDPHIVAEQIGARWFARIFSSLNPLSFALQFLRTTLGILAQYLLQAKRNIYLKRGKPLDSLHFYYFTTSNLRDSLEHFGRIIDLLHLPGTNSTFGVVRVETAATRPAAP